MAILTLEAAKTWLGIKLTDTTQDSLVGDLIATAEGLIASYCGCAFQPTAVVDEIQDGRRSDSIVPEHYPVISVEALRLAGETLDPSEYLVMEEEIALKRQVTPMGRGTVAIDYTHGYASVPAQVVTAAKITVEAYYRQKSRGSVGITSRGKEGETISYKDAWSSEWGLPKEVLGLLAQYRTLEFPTAPMAPRMT
jgi:hypothetical protein